MFAVIPLPSWSVRRSCSGSPTYPRRMDPQTPAPPSPSPKLRRAIGRHLARLSIRWACPALSSGVRVEFSGRLRTALGRCSPKGGVIRLSTALLAPGNRPLLSEALTHEAAHLAVHLLHGPNAKPHGIEWRQLMQSVGLEPRLRLRLPEPVTQDALPRVPRSQYEYRCPVCQSTYRSRRRDSRIRCRPCVEAGLGGLMTITRRSFTAKSQSP